MVFSFNTATRDVLEQVVRDSRFQELTKLPVFAPLEIILGLGAFCLFALGTGLYVSGDIPFVVMLVLNSAAIYASFTPLHDATHRSVSSNRRVNDAIGSICCLLLLPGITTRIYRYLHLEHHRFAGNRIKDPDEPFVSASPFLLPFLLAGLDVHWSIWYLRHWRSRPLGERIEFVGCMTFYVGLHIAFLLSPFALEFLLCFMLPQRVGLFLVAWFFAHIQHPDGVEWEVAPFQTTVLVNSSVLARWLMLGQTFHCLHHLAPSIPYYRYRQAWLLGQQHFERQAVPTRTLWRASEDLKLPIPNQQIWFSARVCQVQAVANDVLAYELGSTDHVNWPVYDAGAHIDVELPDGKVRQFSLSRAASTHQPYRIAVKRDPHGAGGSEYLHENVRQGDTLKVSAPRNNFPLRPEFEHFVLMAGGIGITPLLAMAEELDRDARSFALHVFAKRETDVAFYADLASLPYAASITLHCGEMTHEARIEIAAGCLQHADNHALYLCGPTGFMSTLAKVAETRSWPRSSIFSETFVPARQNVAENRAFEVQLASTGEVLTVAKDEYLLDVLHDHGYAVTCSCTQGICGSCITPVLEGVPEHRDAIMSDSQRAANNRMTVCVSRARSERLVLDL